MSLSYVRYVADGIADEFDVTFPFANRTHVKVTIDGNPPVLPIRWAGESRIKIADRIAAGSIVELRRETPVSTRLVDFQNGSVLTEEDLDKAIDQLFFLHQELRDLCSDTVGGGLARVVNGGSAVLDALVENILTSVATQSLENALSDIANQGNTLATLALETTTLGSGLAQSNVLLAEVDTRLTTLRADHDGLVATVDALLGGDPGTGIATLIQDEANARIEGDTALANTLALIGAKSGDNLAFILDTSKVRVSPTESLASRLSTLSATDAANAAAVVTEQNARVAGDTALSNSLSALTARVGTAEANIISDRQARINGDNALASDLALLGVRTAGGSAWQLNLSTVQIGNGETLATRLNTLAAADATAAAAIASEQTARVGGDNALAQSISTLTTRVNGNEASITTLQQTVNGVTARYGVSLNVNGYITGFVQNNNGQSGSFDILADRFRVVVPGQQPREVFTIDGTSIALNGNVAVNGSLLINGTLQTAKIEQNAVSNSAYWQTTFGGSMASFPLSVWTDFNTTIGGGSGGGGGGSGGGGGGFEVNQL